MTRALRFAAPNLVTCLGLTFGLFSMDAAFRGHFVAAGWWILWAVIFDRLDGLVARLLRATSAFGVQMDSFADAINFGVAPAFLIYSALTSAPELGYAAGPGRAALGLAMIAWVLANVLRLARFNVVSGDAPKGLFFGVPTTLAAGTVAVWFLVVLKYAAPDNPLAPPVSFGGPRLLGNLAIGAGAWKLFPPAMLLLAFLMMSNVPIPKVGRMRSRGFTAFVLSSTLVGMVCGLTRTLPEFMAWMPTAWLVLFIPQGLFSRRYRGLRPPPMRAHPEVASAADDEDEDELPELQHEHQRG